MGNDGSDYILKVNKHSSSVAGTDDLLPSLYKILRLEFAEVWLSQEDQTMALLTNRARKRAFVMFLPEHDPAGFHAISGEETGADEEFEFVLDNGQVDDYPARDTVALLDGLRALKYFFIFGGMAPFLPWHHDGPTSGQL